MLKEKLYYLHLLHLSKKDIPYTFNPKYIKEEEKLYKLYGKSKSLPNSLNLIVVSDTHDSLEENDFKDYLNKHQNYDICILLGDHSTRDIEIILKYIDKTKLYGLLGNHDTNYLKKYNIENLNGSLIEINNIKILGIEGSFKYKEETFPSFTEEESLNFLHKMPRVDILFSHDNRFDKTKRNDPTHKGLFGITYYLYKNQISYHIHGHNHKNYETTLKNGTKEISIYMYKYIELR